MSGKSETPLRAQKSWGLPVLQCLSHCATPALDNTRMHSLNKCGHFLPFSGVADIFVHPFSSFLYLHTNGTHAEVHSAFQLMLKCAKNKYGQLFVSELLFLCLCKLNQVSWSIKNPVIHCQSSVIPRWVCRARDLLPDKNAWDVSARFL